MGPFGFGAETDQEETEMRFWIQFTMPGMPEGTFELVANGKTVVRREPARKVEGNRFRINAQIIDMPHAGEDEVLGAFQVNVDPDRPTRGVIEGVLDPKTNEPIIDAQHPAQGYFDVHFLVTTPFGEISTGPDPARVQNNAITTLFPTSPYTHQMQQAVLSLFLKGQLSQPIARLVSGFHVKKQSPAPGKSARDAGCCGCGGEPFCEKGVFEVNDRDGFREQLLFSAGSSASVNAEFGYATVTNEGPRVVLLFWDGAPPSHEDASRKVVVLPRNSATVKFQQALKVVFSATPSSGLSGNQARGAYEVCWCCSCWQGGAAQDLAPDSKSGDAILQDLDQIKQFQQQLQLQQLQLLQLQQQGQLLQQAPGGGRQGQGGGQQGQGGQAGGQAKPAKFYDWPLALVGKPHSIFSTFGEYRGASDGLTHLHSGIDLLAQAADVYSSDVGLLRRYGKAVNKNPSAGGGPIRVGHFGYNHPQDVYAKPGQNGLDPDLKIYVFEPTDDIYVTKKKNPDVKKDDDFKAEKLGSKKVKEAFRKSGGEYEMVTFWARDRPIAGNVQPRDLHFIYYATDDGKYEDAPEFRNALTVLKDYKNSKKPLAKTLWLYSNSNDLEGFDFGRKGNSAKLPADEKGAKLKLLAYSNYDAWCGVYRIEYQIKGEGGDSGKLMAWTFLKQPPDDESKILVDSKLSAFVNVDTAKQTVYVITSSKNSTISKDNHWELEDKDKWKDGEYQITIWLNDIKEAKGEGNDPDLIEAIYDAQCTVKSNADGSRTVTVTKALTLRP